jgi:hypothetical protein
MVDIDLTNPIHTLFKTEHRLLICIDANPNDQFVEKRQRPVDYIRVSKCNWVKGSRKKGDAHMDSIE